jgi:type II secretory pathway pseudopilin PulG
MDGNELSVISCPLSVVAAGERSALPPQAGVRQQRPSIARRRLGLQLTTTRPGFSFTEILFAVMILGIGFIMIAAMFPVAIKQTQATQEETVAASIAKSGADYLARNATEATMPPFPPAQAPPNPPLPAGSSTVVASGPFWTATTGNFILPSDTRYAWVPFYRREAGSPFAQVIVIATQVRNRTNFDSTDFLNVSGPTGFQVPNLMARPVRVTLKDGVNGPDTITFAQASGTDYRPFVAEGCYVVIGSDPGILIPPVPYPNNTPPQVRRTANGYVFRVGLPRPDISPSTWELMPGNDMKGASYKPINGAVLAYIVGRGHTNPDPRNPDANPSGPAMDIAVYTTFVRVNTAQ